MLDNLAEFLQLHRMPVLDIEEMKRDALARMELAQKVEELQELLSKTHPGARLYLMTPDDERRSLARSEARFDALTGPDQVIQVLAAKGEPLELQTIIGLLRERGSSMSTETLMSILSRGKDELFSNVARGIWSLSPEAMIRFRRVLPSTRRTSSPP